MTVHRIYRTILFLGLTILLGITSPVAAYESNRELQTERISAGHQVFLPIIHTSPKTTTDLTIAGLESTQAIQTLDNTIPMVAGRATAVRVYAMTNTPEAINDLQVSLEGSRDGIPLPGSPLIAGPGSAWPDSTHIDTLRGNITQSFNFQLPPEWLSGQVTLVATLDPDNTVPELDETNNSTSIAQVYHNIPPLDIMVVPIEYLDINEQRIYPPSSPGFMQRALMELYPVAQVNISVHPAYQYAGDLNDETGFYWFELLDEITALKRSENSPASQVYYGLIPLKDESGQHTWIRSGIAGLGWIGLRASIGLTDAYDMQIYGGWIAAHEVGHNLGREHSPCGDVAGPDPYYPYPGGIIGQFGFQTSAFRVVPSTRPDVMSYCEPVWVSDYTYMGFYDDQFNAILAEVSASPQDSIYIRAYLDDDGVPEWKPVYTFTTIPTPLKENSEYAIEFVDKSGKVVATYPVDILRAEEPGIQVNAINAVVPRPVQPYAHLRILRHGEPIAEKTLSTALLPEAIAPTISKRDQQLTVKWGAPQIPAMVRYTMDDGKTWVTLGIDLLGGELELSLADLPAGLIHFEVTLADHPASNLTIDWQEGDSP